MTNGAWIIDPKTGKKTAGFTGPENQVETKQKPTKASNKDG